MKRAVLLLVAAAVTLPGTALAARGAQVPAFTLHRIQARTGDSSYLPTRVPAHYRYGRWTFTGGKLTVLFANTSGHDSFSFEVTKLSAATACDFGGAFNRIIQMDGNRVYYGGEAGYWVAWRCVTSPKSGQRYVLSVRSKGPLPDVALARVDASGKRFAA